MEFDEATTEQLFHPQPDYEDIVIRELTIGFAGNTQELLLFPEDELLSDAAGNIQVTFKTLPTGDAEFVAYAGHTQWHRLQEFPQRRIKGTLRPDPKKMMEEFRRQREQKE